MYSALFFGAIIIASALTQFAAEPQFRSESNDPINEKTRLALLSIAASRGLTNVAELASPRASLFVVFGATNRSHNLSTYRILSLIRSSSLSSGTNNFLLESDQVHTNFMIRIGSKERWFGLGPATPLDFAQHAAGIWFKENAHTDRCDFLSCERPTNAADVVKLSLGNADSLVPTTRSYYFRVREDRLILLLSETRGHDWITRIGSSPDDPYFPPGSEETEKRYRQQKTKENKPLPLPAQIE